MGVMKKAFSKIFTVLLFLVYFFAFPLEGELEAVVNPEWFVEADLINVSQDYGTDLVPFESQNKFGFIDAQGKISYLSEKQYGVVFSENSFISYSWVSNNLVLRDELGSIKSSIDIHAYPIIKNGRYFAISSDRSVFSEFDQNGDVLWTRSFISNISSVDVNDKYVALGFLDSRLLLLDALGQNILVQNLEGSRIGVVYGVLVSDDSEYVSVVYGIDPQRLIVFKKDKNMYKIRRDILLDSSYRREVLIGKLQSKNLAYLEQDKDVVFFNLKSKLVLNEAKSYRLKNVGCFDEENDLYYFISSNGVFSELKVFTPGKGIFLKYDFESADISVDQFEKALLFRDDEKLIKIGVVKK